MAACKSCGAEIRWVRMHPSGKRMPLDAKPEKRILLESASDPEPEGRMVDVYTSHFVTCPQAGEHRRRS